MYGFIIVPVVPFISVLLLTIRFFCQWSRNRIDILVEYVAQSILLIYFN